VKKRIVVIGSGFASMAAATSLADQGYKVVILEKNEQAGGRARQFKTSGFTFDMGPSWYWMPDVFEKYFQNFGKEVKQYYQLDRLDPSYKIFFEDEEWLIPATLDELKADFEKREAGSAAKLDKFLKEAEYKYRVGMDDLVHKPSRSILEFANWKVISGVFKMQLFSSLSSHVHKYFKDNKIRKLLEFPVLFLGAEPAKTPALYSLMNYADIVLGTWYPQGGMHEIVKAMKKLAEDKGVEFRFQSEVQGFDIENAKIVAAITSSGKVEGDVFVSGADYHHTEQLLGDDFRNYSEDYWDSRKMAPSSLLFYLGIDRKVDKLLHHNLFFDEDFDQHAKEIYDQPAWPTKPLFYASAPSKTDSTVAPDGCENVFLLMPVAPNLEDGEEMREKYYEMMMDRLEERCGHPIREHVIYKRSYAHSDFKADYHAYKGNAYGLANTLRQTAILKPSLKNKKLKNFYYTGQLTTPGPGVPPSLISGQVVAKEVIKQLS
jgi:phytoene desaturase